MGPMIETHEPVRPEYVFHDGLFSVGPMMLNLSRIVAMFSLALTTVVNWKRFGLMTKFLAVMLFLQVLTFPTLIRLREKRSGKRVDKSVIAQMAYFWIMLVAMVFSSHVP